MRLLEYKNIPNEHPNIWFGQLYGMSDHLSFNLAKAGYNVAKYIPFGPVREVLPYLIRRAEENTSVAGQSSRELEMIVKELKRRRSKVAGAA
jgi:proline dehydrogenase